MKRLLTLAALSLAAVPLLSSPAVAQTSTAIRGATEKVTATTTPARDRSRPYVFTTRGRIVPPAGHCAFGVLPTAEANCLPIVCPPGATAAQYCQLPGPSAFCRGDVTIRYQKFGTTISSRVFELRPDCTYRGSVTFKSRLRTRIGRLTVMVRFQGNQLLRPRASSTQDVRAG
ncbi:MAG TPA: hypothetical protein VNA28_03115 [Solirubrobacteraceae bacterium]|nr:hypothetical protein [Solirubrobacteraceae bacterium]